MNSVNYDILYALYVEQRKPMWRVAQELGVAVGTVYNYIKRYEIPTRDTADYPATEKQRETWKMIGRRGKGRRLSAETRRKISISHFKGGIGHKKKRSDGYIAIYFPDHPKATAEGYVMEHVLVIEAVIGRHLNEDECVHHINEKRDDNRKSNLKLMTKSEHMSYPTKKRHAKKRGDDLSIQ